MQPTLDRDVKLFFALGNALMDASISAWVCKYLPQDNFVRPITAIRERYKDKQVTLLARARAVWRAGFGRNYAMGGAADLAYRWRCACCAGAFA
jgi:hypothetical protein